jgi:hypothetical protein
MEARSELNAVENFEQISKSHELNIYEFLFFSGGSVTNHTTPAVISQSSAPSFLTTRYLPAIRRPSATTAKEA